MGTRKKKKKETHVVRYYGEEGTDSEGFWVDVETLGKINLQGRQGNPPLTSNNLSQERTVTLAPDKKDENRKLDTERVYGAGDETKDLFVDVPINDTIAVKTGKHYQYLKTGRWFDNGARRAGNRAEIEILVRRNEIDDKYLNDVTDSEGRTTKQPPTDPEKYLEAVHATDDMRPIDDSLYVVLINKYAVRREKGASFQGIEFNGIWDNCLLYQKPKGSDYDMMPGSHEDPAIGEPVRLDPLQILVNFGFNDTLAVKFGNKEEDANPKEEEEDVKEDAEKVAA